ncbi:hypothetical protein BCR33DRAFT_717770 [Rhizoclosmatium globosum]|uniref:Uncharacterized protein n=1 Tax=Rhizoclosmatium globosum TaxID=329046 RepID=A0A1Y2C7N2_9FUNG|nr:hypothetical protein BCR33DRAFT_717770 [Rhizoclosmatium globosum]|eukprot:ORY43039.1 hypothetical protein BCR33DRAFT_717770 [Rhizoclosmatium globosum]
MPNTVAPISIPAGAAAPDTRRRSSISGFKRSSVAPVAGGEDKRTSLLDVTRDNLVKQGKTFILYRVIVCGKLDDSSKKTEISSHYQRFFKVFQNDSELITGMLLMFQDTYVHVLEASEKVVTAFLRELRGILPASFPRTPEVFQTPPDSSNPSPNNNNNNAAAAAAENASLAIGSSFSSSIRNQYFSASKVLLLAGDVSGRTYSFWASRSIELGAGAAPYYVDEMMFNEENLERTIAKLCVDITSIGIGLSSLSKADLKQAMEDMASKFEDVLPRNEMIKYIMNECHAMTTVQEWAEIYDSHMEVAQTTEHVWPAPKMIEV